MQEREKLSGEPKLLEETKRQARVIETSFEWE